MSLPAFTPSGDLPPGVYRATLGETVERFASGSLVRTILGRRLERLYRLATDTGCLARFVVFGSFVTTKSKPNDVDVFLLMEDAFDLDQFIGEPRLLFDHLAAQAHFGASVFWLRRLAAIDGEAEAVAHWQLKRDGSQRGIVEIVEESG